MAMPSTGFAWAAGEGYALPSDGSALRPITLDPATPWGLVVAFVVTFGAGAWILFQRARLAYATRHRPMA